MKVEIQNEKQKEEFEMQRKKLLKHRFKLAKNPDNLIPIEDLDYYLDKLQELRNR